MNTAFIYIRVSDESQARSGLGLEAQKARCLAMATVKGWNVPESGIYADKGITGTISERPAIERLLRDIQREKPEAVIISSLDRLGRRRRIIEDMIQEIGRYTNLVSCKESFDTTTAAGRFVLNIFMDLAELERDTISERTHDALAALGAQGMQRGAVPYGKMRGIPRTRTLTNGKIRTTYSLIPNPHEQDVIERIVSLRIAGSSIAGIARTLTGEGIYSRSGKPWHTTQVSRILASLP